MSQKRFFTPRSEIERASDFIAAAEITKQLGMDCYNICVKPSQDNSDQVRGFEKRCVQGCVGTNLNIWMVNARAHALTKK